VLNQRVLGAGLYVQHGARGDESSVATWLFVRPLAVVMARTVRIERLEKFERVALSVAIHVDMDMARSGSTEIFACDASDENNKRCR
jgi:hypothetical protein